MIGVVDATTGEHRRLRGFDYETADGRVLFLQVTGNTAVAAARADEIAEMRDRMAGLAPDFRPGMTVMGEWITGARELVGTKRAALAGDTRGYRFDPFQVGARNLPGKRGRRLVDQHHLGAERGHHARTLHRVAARHDSDERVIPDRANYRQPGAHVSRGQLDHRLPRAQFAALLRFIDNHARGAILLGKSRVHEFELGQNAAVEAGADSIQRDQRRIADGVDGGLERSFGQRAGSAGWLTANCTHFSREFPGSAPFPCLHSWRGT